jgi:coronin-1B/1C/6
VLVTASADLLVKLWDITTGQDVLTLNGHAEVIQSLSFNQSGSLMVTTCKDKVVRIYDIRSSKTSDRQVYIWDTKNMSQPLKQENIDTASG